ncbi:unnamed protein product [Brassica napus]|uniref:(rape) hypothetical protein n=1 Tax=Brassica napus TaxID=3708 RepID=A0A816RZR8_BRANA|nr:unnamed protein product [Brassica napus]
MRSFYPELFSSDEVPEEVDVNSGANSCLVGESCHIRGPSPIFSDKARDDFAHVEKTPGFSPSSSIKRRQPLRFSPETQNLAKPCPVGERAAAGHQTTTGVTASHRSTAGDRVISPERRSCRVSIPSRRFLESSTIFLLDPATGEGFGWKPTLFLVDLVSKDP